MPDTAERNVQVPALQMDSAAWRAGRMTPPRPNGAAAAVRPERGHLNFETLKGAKIRVRYLAFPLKRLERNEKPLRTGETFCELYGICLRKLQHNLCVAALGFDPKCLHALLKGIKGGNDLLKPQAAGHTEGVRKAPTGNGHG